MAQAYIGEVRIVSWNFPPRGWALCNGQLLAINQNQALFSILGTTYGGDGVTTFALPNLQGRIPVHSGNTIALGERAGETSHTLLMAEMPAHTHVPVGSSTLPPTAPAATGNLWSADNGKPFAPTPTVKMNPACIQNTGNNQAHENMSPYLVLNFIIALQGIFPSRN
ncbi:MAG TPA: tail fiber protein [Candidatus Angelobacter sp.]|jgi:microcystin-dependent protein|nr:tail fiber protein [Candidatus Angelobacter sp.]